MLRQALAALCLLQISAVGFAQGAGTKTGTTDVQAQLPDLGSTPQDVHQVAYRDLIDGVQDGQWVEVTGTVHSVTPVKLTGQDALSLKLALDGGSVSVLVQDPASLDAQSMIDSTVRVRGIFSNAMNGMRQAGGAGLIVTDKTNIETQKAAPSDPFSIPLTSIRNVVQLGSAAHSGRRVRIRGTVTYVSPSHFLYLQDGRDGIEVQAPAADQIAPGKLVEAIGYPFIGDYSPIMQDATLRVVGSGTPITPQVVNASDIISEHPSFKQAPHEQLATMQGEVLESHLQEAERVWILRQNGKVFEAHLPLTSGDVKSKFTSSGSTLSLTGICRVHGDADHNPISFDLLLRSSQDVTVLHSSSWWKLSDTFLLLAFLIGVAVVIVLWNVIQERNIREQTRIIRESEQKFRDLAECDVLTGLPNRLTLEERIAQSLATCDRENIKAAILTIDIDRFKQINDTFGHLVGDECLKAVAERLKSKIRSGDTIARTGGEEFTLIISRLSTREGARKVCSTLLNLFNEPLILSERALTLTVSIGAAMYPDDGTDSKTLRKRSDQALYEAKRTGRNRAVFASQELSESSEMASLVESKLREDLRFNRFRLYFQPICDASKNICRFEALLRSPNMHLAKIGPGQFIPIAEECGLIVPLGKWVIKEVCRQMAEWRALGMTLRPVAVNVSGRQLVRKEFVAEVLQDIKRYNIEPEMLELELTETTIMSKLGTASDTIAELANAGITFAIDDFGTGYSSLSRLNQLPIKALKIDASFVRQLELESGSYTIVRAVMQMAKSLGLHVIAEGIERHDQFEILRALGCDYFQGYLIGKPMPAEEAIARIEQNHDTLIQNQTNPHWSSHLVPKSFEA